MSQTLTNWERPFFQPGGGDPFLFYVVFGSLSTDISLSGSQYRCAGIPDGIELMSYEKNSQPDVFEMFLEGYLWDELQKSHPAMATEIQHAPDCFALRGTISDPPTLNYLRDITGLLTYFLDHGACTIYDPQKLQWWTPEIWREEIFAPASSVPRHHTLIILSEEEGSTEKQWIHTRGLRKFGRPDLSFRNVSKAHFDGVIDLCNRFIEYQALGGIIEEGSEIRMQSLPPGGIARHRGNFDDPDFNNVHVEISWDGADSNQREN